MARIPGVSPAEAGQELATTFDYMRHGFAEMTGSAPERGIEPLEIIAHVPALLSLAGAWALARLNILGRSVLVMWAVAAATEALGWQPQRNPTQVLPVWGTITGALAVWKYRYTILSWFGLRRKTIENDAAGRPAITINR